MREVGDALRYFKDDENGRRRAPGRDVPPTSWRDHAGRRDELRDAHLLAVVEYPATHAGRGAVWTPREAYSAPDDEICGIRPQFVDERRDAV